MTASNFKYKTFVNREELSEVLRAAAASMHQHNHHHNQHHSSNNMPSAPSSASALYSQTSSRSSNPNTRYVYTYYLNALIESEQDEGVYQCINPDSPNFVLRNVTVLIASKISLSLYSFINSPNFVLFKKRKYRRKSYKNELFRPFNFIDVFMFKLLLRIFYSNGFSIITLFIMRIYINSYCCCFCFFIEYVFL